MIRKAVVQGRVVPVGADFMSIPEQFMEYRFLDAYLYVDLEARDITVFPVDFVKKQAGKNKVLDINRLKLPPVEWQGWGAQPFHGMRLLVGLASVAGRLRPLGIPIPLDTSVIMPESFMQCVIQAGVRDGVLATVRDYEDLQREKNGEEHGTVARPSRVVADLGDAQVEEEKVKEEVAEVVENKTEADDEGSVPKPETVVDNVAEVKPDEPRVSEGEKHYSGDHAAAGVHTVDVPKGVFVSVTHVGDGGPNQLDLDKGSVSAEGNGAIMGSGESTGMTKLDPFQYDMVLAPDGGVRSDWRPDSERSKWEKSPEFSDQRDAKKWDSAGHVPRYHWENERDRMPSKTYGLYNQLLKEILPSDIVTLIGMANLDDIGPERWEWIKKTPRLDETFTRDKTSGPYGSPRMRQEIIDLFYSPDDDPNQVIIAYVYDYLFGYTWRRIRYKVEECALTYELAWFLLGDKGYRRYEEHMAQTSGRFSLYRSAFDLKKLHYGNRWRTKFRTDDEGYVVTKEKKPVGDIIHNWRYLRVDELYAYYSERYETKARNVW